MVSYILLLCTRVSVRTRTRVTPGGVSGGQRKNRLLISSHRIVGPVERQPVELWPLARTPPRARTTRRPLNPVRRRPETVFSAGTTLSRAPPSTRGVSPRRRPRPPRRDRSAPCRHPRTSRGAPTEEGSAISADAIAIASETAGSRANAIASETTGAPRFATRANPGTTRTRARAASPRRRARFLSAFGVSKAPGKGRW